MLPVRPFIHYEKTFLDFPAGAGVKGAFTEHNTAAVIIKQIKIASEICIGCSLCELDIEGHIGSVLVGLRHLQVAQGVSETPQIVGIIICDVRKSFR